MVHSVKPKGRTRLHPRAFEALGDKVMQICWIVGLGGTSVYLRLEGGPGARVCEHWKESVVAHFQYINCYRKNTVRRIT